ncbi:efflux RND transporter periplasmic adaptor subunit [Flavobacterium sp. Sd200]|uniref:efflux RND transporter periplasmic adaptor subunit n=1 Tax=Flavobacterium TaxID=237 RepID=UPI000E3112D5|nr:MULTISPECIES: efflux RND transporter periplasmic adaptor subunit [Flavobacterium]MXN89646.1 efflux RND transporter periplasmic adaptor subunit [Flavobacterium sp. Sd200]
MKKYIIVTAAILALVSCGKKEETETKAETTQASAPNIVTLTPEQAKNAGIVVGSPEEKELSGTVQLQGEVTVPPQSLVNVTFPLGGYIRKTNVQPGMHVQKGQVLAIIEDMQYIQLQQDYLTAKELFNVAEMEYTRQKELNAKKASSDKLFEQISAERETQRIATASLKQKLELLGVNVSRLTSANISKSISILSPVSGLVSKVNVNVGKYVAPTEMLFELTDMNDVMLTFNAFEKDVQYLKTGQQLDVYSNDNPEKKYTAKIQFINHSLNADRAAVVTAKLYRYDVVFIPGLFVNANIHIKNKKQLALPQEAIVDWQGKSYVFEDKGNGSYTMIAVKTGILQDGFKQFESETITVSSKLVVKNAYSLLMKAMNSGEEE